MTWQRVPESPMMPLTGADRWATTLVAQLGDVFRQYGYRLNRIPLGEGPGPGAVGETLYWDGNEWVATDELTVTPGVGAAVLGRLTSTLDETDAVRHLRTGIGGLAIGVGGDGRLTFQQTSDSGAIENQWLHGERNGGFIFYHNNTQAARTQPNGIASISTTIPVTEARFRADGVFAAIAGFASAANNVAARTHAAFENPNGVVGTIVTNASATAYNTTSDARLKVEVERAAHVLEKVRAVPVRTARMITEPEGAERDMFYAQELYEHFPEAVTPATEDLPHTPWMVDHSKLVPTLWAAVQEHTDRTITLEDRIVTLEDRIVTLEDRIATLEGRRV